MSDYVPRGGFLASTKTLAEAREGLRWFNNDRGGHNTILRLLFGFRIGKDDTLQTEVIQGGAITTFIARNGQAKFEDFVEDAVKAYEKGQIIAVIAHKTHRSLQSIKALQDDSQANLVILGQYRIADIFVDREDGNKKVIVLLRKVCDSQVWWEKAPPGFADVSSERKECCQHCKFPLVKRFVGKDAYCGRPQCPSEVDDAPKVKSEAAPSDEVAVEEPAEAIKPTTKQYKNERNRTKDAPKSSKAVRIYEPSYLHGPIQVPTPVPGAREVSLLPPAVEALDLKQLKERFKEGEEDRLLWQANLCSCGHITRRIHWTHYECRKCQARLDIKPPTLKLEDLVDEKHLNADVTHHDIIKQCWWDTDLTRHHTPAAWTNIPSLKPEPFDLIGTGLENSYIAIRFNLYDHNSLIALYPKQSTIEAGSKSQFSRLNAAVQSGEIDLRRQPVIGNDVTSDKITRHFTKNYGVHYQQAPTATDDTPFSAEPAILRDLGVELARIVNLVCKVLPDFNEHLVVGMLHQMGMKWHADGEKQIKGEIIASISLGGDATMSFGYMPEEVGRKKTEDPLKLFEFPLRGTGCIMIQVGKTLNKYYKHKVEAEGLVRFAVTARCLSEPEKKEQKKSGKRSAKKRAADKMEEAEEQKGAKKPRKQRAKKQ